MAVTNYYSVNGQVLGECTSGVETSYMSDALGSTIGPVTSAGVQNRYVYSPHGLMIAKTGTGTDPRFLWMVSAGLEFTSRTMSEYALGGWRYSSGTGRFTTPSGHLGGSSEYSFPSAAISTGYTDIVTTFDSFIHRAADSRGVSPKICPAEKGIYPPKNNWLPIPDIWFGNLLRVRYVQGDHRDFFERGTSRLKLRFHFNSCLIGALGPADVIVLERAQGTSQGLSDDFDGCFTYDRDTGDMSLSQPTIVNHWGALSHDSEITFTYSGKDPLITIAPPIRVTATFRYEAYPNQIVSHSVTGSHTKYPWHESMVTPGGHVYTYTASVGGWLDLLSSSPFSSKTVTFGAKTWCKTKGGGTH